MGFQLTLGLKLSAKSTLENFIGEKNQEIIRFLIDRIDNRKQALAYIQGPQYSGKSHLLQACCHRLVYQGLQAAYLDLNQMDNLNILNGLDQLRLVCFDNWSTKNLDPSQLLMLEKFINIAIKQQHIILLSSTEEADKEFFQKFESYDDFKIHSLNTEEMPLALEQKLEERGLCLSETLQKLIIQKAGPSVKEIQDILDIIEKSQDSEKRKINTSLLKKLLATA